MIQPSDPFNYFCKLPLLFDRPLGVMLVSDFGKVGGKFVWCIFPTFSTENICGELAKLVVNKMLGSRHVANKNKDER